MRPFHKDVWLGVGTVLFGLMLLLYAIPEFISAPSNVRKLVLSPLFWPKIIAYIIIVLGFALTAASFASRAETASAPLGEERYDNTYAWIRIAASAILMVGLVLSIPLLGMVLASCLMFVLFSVIIATPRPIMSVIVALILPFVLYAFFAHVAGVSIPQGRFLILP